MQTSARPAQGHVGVHRTFIGSSSRGSLTVGALMIRSCHCRASVTRLLTAAFFFFFFPPGCGPDSCCRQAQVSLCAAFYLSNSSFYFFNFDFALQIDSTLALPVCPRVGHAVVPHENEPVSQPVKALSRRLRLRPSPHNWLNTTRRPHCQQPLEWCHRGQRWSTWRSDRRHSPQ